MKQSNLRSILFVGNYREDYSRNSIYIKGLRRNKLKVIEFNIKSYNFMKQLLVCLKSFKRLYMEKYDVILMFAPNNFQLLLAKWLSKIKKIPLVHDIYTSKLQTYYYDRKLYGKRKFPKLFYKIFYFLLDLIECCIVDYIILDTYSHIKFFHEKYNIPIKKFLRIYIGAQDDIFYPLNKKKNNQKFIVGFWGTFIPLQGIEYILKAAKIMERYSDIKFILIGKGQTYHEMIELSKKLELPNVEFKGFIPLRELPKYIAEFNIGLGIFGDTNKMLQVIPNKIYEGNAMKLPMISGDSPAIRELYNHNKDILLCKRADPESLSESILNLKQNDELQENLKKNSYQIFIKYCSIEALSKRLISFLNQILRKM